MTKKEYIMKYLFTLIFTFFTTLSVSLYSAYKFANYISGNDSQVRWCCIFPDSLQLSIIFKRISINNKLRIYDSINSLGFETIIDTLIDDAVINDSADLDLFCKRIFINHSICLSEDQIKKYRIRLRTLTDAEKQMFKAFKTINYNTLRYFLKQGVRVNAQDKHGHTTLIYAVCNDKTECVRLLLEYLNINVNAQDENGYTALIHAVRNGKTECVRLLLQHPSINVNAKDKHGCTALMYAQKLGFIECKKLLYNFLISDNENSRNLCTLL